MKIQNVIVSCVCILLSVGVAIAEVRTDNIISKHKDGKSVVFRMLSRIVYRTTYISKPCRIPNTVPSVTLIRNNGERWKFLIEGVKPSDVVIYVEEIN